MARTRPALKKSPITAGLDQAHSLLADHYIPEARHLLVELDRTYPNHPEVLIRLAQLCQELRDLATLVDVAERLVRFHPRDPDLLFSLASAYQQARHPALGLRTFRRFLADHPEHQSAADAGREIALLEEAVRREIAATGLPPEDALCALELDEELRALTRGHRHREARKIAAELISRFPRFAPGLNSIARLHLSEGETAQALLLADQALQVGPDDVAAHATRVRALCLLGRMDEAKGHRERLRAIPVGPDGMEIERAEALSYLGDDEGVLEVFRQVEASGRLSLLGEAGVLCHLAAVAELRLGHEAEAARLWDEALRLQPLLDAARQNVTDRQRPTGQQHAPWPFAMSDWVPQHTINDLKWAMQGRKTDEAMQKGAQRFLSAHPEMVGLVPVLLDRGDPQARVLALMLAQTARTDELLHALRDFAQGTRGLDAMRSQAAGVAMDAGLIPQGPVRLFTQGEWREVRTFRFEVQADPADSLPGEAAKLLAQSIEDLNRDHPERAERLLRQAVELSPEVPVLHNNLAAALCAQRRNREAEALLHSAHARFPDDVAITANIARCHLRRRELAEAEALLEPFLSRKGILASDFACLCGAKIDIALARHEGSAARLWLGMWEQAVPRHPDLELYRTRIEHAKGGTR